MIKYSLKCRSGHEFECWFASAANFEDQAAQGRVTCPTCDTSDVRKAIMAPALAHAREPALADVSIAQQRQMLAEIRAFRHYLFGIENVGRRFPEEARKIAEGEGEDRPIRGQTTADEAEKLLEEGIHILPIPLLPEDFN